MVKVLFQRIILLFLFLFVANYSFAQITNPSQDLTIEKIIENIAENSSDDADFGTIYDDLIAYSEKPLNLNVAQKSDLEKLHFLSDKQVQSILQFINWNGLMMSIFELQLIPNLDEETIEMLLPFVKVEPLEMPFYFPLKEVFTNGKHQLFLRNQFAEQNPAGYQSQDGKTADYLGNKYHYYVKYQYQYRNKLLWGFTLEKDPGEQFFKGTQKRGFDYSSFYIQLTDIKQISKLVIGDFAIQFGQGLVAWSGMSSGKSSMVMNIAKRPQGLKKYSSSDENLFFRGIASTISITKQLDITAFVSRKDIDASLAIDTTDEQFIASSLPATGLHNTENEMEKRHAQNIAAYGTNLTFRGENIRAGASMMGYSYQYEITPDSSRYNQFTFRGKNNYNIGLDYKYFFKEMEFFGEVAMDKNRAIASVHGAVFSLAPRLSLSMLYRYYDKKYQAFFSNPFRVNSETSNESGIYTGCEFYPAKKIKISAYLDSYKFEWLKFQTIAPAKGYDYFVQADYSMNRSVRMSMRWKSKTSPETSSADPEATMAQNTNTKATSFRYHISYQLLPNFKMANRAEVTHYEKESTCADGFMIYQDIQ